MSSGTSSRARARSLALACCLAAPACISPVMVSPRAARDAAERRPGDGASAAQKVVLLRAVAADYDAGHEYLSIFPRSRALETMGTSLVTLGFTGADIGQKTLDQLAPDSLVALARAAPLFDHAVCSAAVQSETFVATSSAFGADDLGNPPDPSYTALWLPVPLKPDPAVGAATKRVSGVSCPAPAGSDHVCLYGRLALQRSKADLIIVVHGLFDSGDQHYLRNTGAVLFSLGYSVLLLDLRDHGQTFRTQLWAPATLGYYEGQDLLAAANYLRSAGCETIERLGLLGYSGGGLASIRAFIADRAAGSSVFDAGVLAVSPILDVPSTLDEMTLPGGRPESCSLLAMTDVPFAATQCLNRNASASVFAELLELRWQTLTSTAGEDAPTSIWDPRSYLARSERVYGLPPNTLLNAIRTTTLAQWLRALPPWTPGQTFLTVVGGKDDPVVGGEPAANLAEALEPHVCSDGDADRTPVCMLTPKIGGHIAYAVISPALARELVRYYFRR